jgi:hypothetical protein
VKSSSKQVFFFHIDVLLHFAVSQGEKKRFKRQLNSPRLANRVLVETWYLCYDALEMLEDGSLFVSSLHYPLKINNLPHRSLLLPALLASTDYAFCFFFVISLCTSIFPGAMILHCTVAVMISTSSDDGRPQSISSSGASLPACQMSH